MTTLVRRWPTCLFAACAIAGLTGCQDKRIKELNTGMPRDSVLSVLSRGAKPGAGIDSLVNVYTSERFLIDGKNYEILYFAPDNQKAGKDSVARKDLTPVVLVDNRLVGKGWAFWDSASAAHKIPVPKRD
jgi:hypothetical protein